MSSRKRRDDWIDDDEYPDDQDVKDFGETSPPDKDPLTIGYMGKRPSFWTRVRVILLVIVLLLIAALLLPEISGLLR
jgi:hypothetical protein